MTSWLWFALNLTWCPALAFLLPPRRTLAKRVTGWLAGALCGGIAYTVAALPSFPWPGTGFWLSALIAAVILWWRRKRPDRALRHYGAKSLARLAALARSMPRARPLVPQGAPS